MPLRYRKKLYKKAPKKLVLKAKLKARTSRKYKRTYKSSSLKLLSDSQHQSFMRWNNYAKSYVRAMKKVSTPQLLQDNQITAFSAPAGKQGAFSISLAGYNVLTNLCNNSFSNPPIATISTNPAATYRNSRTTRILLESVVSDLVLTNNTQATEFLDIYHIIRKQNGLKNDDSDTPVTAWQTGVYDAQKDTDPNKTPLAYQFLSSRPTDSILFNKYFKVVKMRSVALTGGTSHRVNSILKINKIVENEYLTKQDGPLAGITQYLMLVLKGQPINIVKTGNVKDLSTATSTLIVQQSVRYKFSYIEQSSRIADIENTIYINDPETATAQELLYPQDNPEAGAISNIPLS